MKTIFMCLVMLTFTASCFAFGSEAAKNKIPNTEVTVTTGDLADVQAVTEAGDMCFRFDVAEIVYAEPSVTQEQTTGAQTRPEIILIE